MCSRIRSSLRETSCRDRPCRESESRFNRSSRIKLIALPSVIGLRYSSSSRSSPQRVDLSHSLPHLCRSFAFQSEWRIGRVEKRIYPLATERCRSARYSSTVYETRRRDQIRKECARGGFASSTIRKFRASRSSLRLGAARGD